MATIATKLPTTEGIELGRDPTDPLWEPPEHLIPMTYEEYLDWRGSQRHSEWAYGKALVLMPSSYIHAALVTFLTALLKLYVEDRNLGVVLTAPFEMRRVELDVAREPDLLFIATQNMYRIEDIRVNGPADLAIEVISDDSSGRDRGRKFDEYEVGGVREYWIADPRLGRHRFDLWVRGTDDVFHASSPDELGRIHSSVLPGFWLHPDWLWASPPQGVLQRFREIVSTSPTGHSTSANE